jgi:murein DD-endopeptidase
MWGADWASQSPAGRRRQSAGNNVTIDHGEVHTSYFHGAQRSKLKVGDRVQAGDFIFTAGTTGASTGNHLHFEVRRRRAQATAVDPMPYLNGNAAVPVLPVSGRPESASWKAWQTWLQDLGYYKARVDGIPGPYTYKAIQDWVGVPQTGTLNPVTRRAVQRELGVTVDGVWGRETWSRLQQKLNAGTL